MVSRMIGLEEGLMLSRAMRSVGSMVGWIVGSLVE